MLRIWPIYFLAVGFLFFLAPKLPLFYMPNFESALLKHDILPKFLNAPSYIPQFGDINVWSHTLCRPLMVHWYRRTVLFIMAFAYKKNQK